MAEESHPREYEELESPDNVVSNEVAQNPHPFHEQAVEKSYFTVDPPKNIIEGISNGEYNLIKGAVAGPYMMVTAPFLGAVEESSKHDALLDQTTGAITGFGKGLVRGVVGGTSLIVTGAITGLNQIRTGLQDCPDTPGHGKGLTENLNHLLNTPYTHLVTNVEPETFRPELEELIRSGALPEKQYDPEGREIEYTYQFFHTNEPTDFWNGINECQYNVGKGILSGAALAVSAPFKDAYDKYHETDEKGYAGGIEGAIAGFGSGVFRGTVGGFCLASAGLVYGAAQLGKGFVSLHNLPKGAQVFNKATEDLQRVTTAPVMELVLQKGFGLEELLEREENERIAAEKAAAEKAAADAAAAEAAAIENSESAETANPLQTPSASAAASAEEDARPPQSPSPAVAPAPPRGEFEKKQPEIVVSPEQAVESH